MDEIIARACRYRPQCDAGSAHQGLGDLPQRAVPAYTDNDRESLVCVPGGKLRGVALGARQHHLACCTMALHHVANGLLTFGAVAVAGHGVHDENPRPLLAAFGRPLLAAFGRPLPRTLGAVAGFFRSAADFFALCFLHAWLSPICCSRFFTVRIISSSLMPARSAKAKGAPMQILIGSRGSITRLPLRLRV